MNSKCTMKSILVSSDIERNRVQREWMDKSPATYCKKEWVSRDVPGVAATDPL